MADGEWPTANGRGSGGSDSPRGRVAETAADRHGRRRPTARTAVGHGGRRRRTVRLRGHTCLRGHNRPEHVERLPVWQRIGARMIGSAALVRARGLTFTYAGAARAAFGPVDLEIGPGEMLLLLGPSGCGKST